MDIYDHRNRLIIPRGKLVKSAQRKNSVPWTPAANRDINELIPPQDHINLLSTSRSLYANDGILKGCIDQKAQYVVGRGYDPKYLGRDEEWGKRATEFLKDWYAIGNVKGDNFGFKKSLEMDSQAIDRDGDSFTLLTQTAKGFPMIQSISASRIACRFGETKVTKGRYRNLRIINGAIINRLGRVVAWRLLGDDSEGKKDKDISARSLIHCMDQDYCDSTRGIPVFSHALDDFKRLIQSSEWEQHAMMINSALARVEHNEDGEADVSSMYSNDDGAVATTTQGVGMQNIEGGQIKYFEAGKGSKIEPLTNDRPSQNYQSFHNRIIRTAIIGVKWSYNLLVNFDGKSVADRSELAKAKKAVESRQDRLTPYAHKKVVYALSRAIELGILPPNEDFYKWSYSRGKSLSIDFGRDANTQIALYDKGISNLTELVEENGRSLEEHLRETYMEEAISIQIKEEVEKSMKVKIDQRNVRLVTPNETGGQPTTTESIEAISGDDDETKRFENLKSKFDAFGTAVRAGALTPSYEDEEAFRKEGGLPPMSKAVRGAWKDDKGYRRPITLQGGAEAQAQQNEATDD